VQYYKQTLTLDGQLDAVNDLAQVARDIPISLQFVVARLQQLLGELAICQAAHFAYVSPA
jgi:hypothetical protein